MTATARDIATTVHDEHGVTPDFAAAVVEYYISTIENLDGRAIDRDAIDDLDAGFIQMALAAAGGAQ